MTKEKDDSDYKKWYYDACSLDSNKDVYVEIESNIKKHNTKAIISHLSLGEAFANCHRKGKEQLYAFIDLISNLKDSDLIKVVGNDHTIKELKDIFEVFDGLHAADALHLATAIYNNCEILRTTDNDLLKLPKKKVLEIAKKYGCHSFCITNMN